MPPGRANCRRVEDLREAFNRTSNGHVIKVRISLFRSYLVRQVGGYGLAGGFPSIKYNGDVLSHVSLCPRKAHPS